MQQLRRGGRARAARGRRPGARPRSTAPARRRHACAAPPSSIERGGRASTTTPSGLAARHAVEPGDAALPKVRSTYMRGGSPGLVLQAARRRRGGRRARLRPRAAGATGGPQRRPRHQRALHQRRRHRHRPVAAERDRGARRGDPPGPDRAGRPLVRRRGGPRPARLGAQLRRLRRRRASVDSRRPAASAGWSASTA